MNFRVYELKKCGNCSSTIPNPVYEKGIEELCDKCVSAHSIRIR